MNTLKLLGLGLLTVGAILGVLALTASSASVSASPIVAVRGVSPDATSDNGQRKLARADDGTLYLAYSGPIEGVEQAQVSFSLDNGQSWKPETVLGQPGIWSDLPTLATGPGGRLDASWVDYISVGHVWHSSKQAGEWSTPEKVSPGEHYAGFPAMVVADDRANLLWYASPPDERREHGSAYEILHTVEVGEAWSVPELLSSSSEDALNPSLAMSPDGALEAAWFQVFQGSYGAQHAEYDGTSWAFPSLISTRDQTATGVSIDVDGEGTIHMVWEQTNEDTIGIAYSLLRDGEWSEQVQLSESFSQDPVVAIDADDRVYVLWTEDEEIRARIWDEGWSPTTILGPGTNPSSLSGDEVLTAWTRQTDAGPEVVTSYLEPTGGSDSTLFYLLGALVALIAGTVVLTAGNRRD